MNEPIKPPPEAGINLWKVRTQNEDGQQFDFNVVGLDLDNVIAFMRRSPFKSKTKFIEAEIVCRIHFVDKQCVWPQRQGSADPEPMKTNPPTETLEGSAASFCSDDWPSDACKTDSTETGTLDAPTNPTGHPDGLPRFWSLPNGTRCAPEYLMWSWIKIGWCRVQWYASKRTSFVFPFLRVRVIHQNDLDQATASTVHRSCDR